MNHGLVKEIEGRAGQVNSGIVGVTGGLSRSWVRMGLLVMSLALGAGCPARADIEIGGVREDQDPLPITPTSGYARGTGGQGAGGEGAMDPRAAEALAIVDAWTRQLVDGALEPIARRVGARGFPGIELAIEGEVKIPVYAKVVYVDGRVKRRIVVARQKSGVYELTLQAEGQLGVGVEAPKLACVDTSGLARLSTTFVADPTHPGEMTRLLWLLATQENSVAAESVVTLMEKVSPGTYRRLADSLGLLVKRVAQVGATHVAVQRQAVQTVTTNRWFQGMARIAAMANPSTSILAPVVPQLMEQTGRAADVPLAAAQEVFEVVASNSDLAAKLAISFQAAPPATRLCKRIKIEGGNYTEGEVALEKVAKVKGGREIALGSEFRLLPDTVTGLTAKVGGKLKGELKGKGQVEVALNMEAKAFDVRAGTLTNIEVVLTGSIDVMGSVFPELIPEELKVSVGPTARVVLTITLKDVLRKLQAARSALPQWREHVLAIKERIENALGSGAQLRKELSSLAAAVDFKVQALVGLTGEAELKVQSIAKLKVKPTLFGMYGDAGVNMWDIIFDGGD